MSYLSVGADLTAADLASLNTVPSSGSAVKFSGTGTSGPSAWSKFFSGVAAGFTPAAPGAPAAPAPAQAAAPISNLPLIVGGVAAGALVLVLLLRK